MKKKSIKLLSVLLCFLMLVGFVACGSGNDGNAEKLVIAYKQEAAEGILTKKMINAFKEKKKKEGVNVNISMFDISLSSYNSDILKQNASQTMADIYHSDDSLAPIWAEKGVFENLTPYFERDNFDFCLYDEMAFDAAKVYNNNIYYAPRSYDQPVVILNLDFFNKYNVTVPTETDWNWSTLVRVCDELRKSIDATEATLVAENYYPLDCCVSWAPIYYTFVYGFGGKILDVENKSFGFTSTQTVNAFKKIDELLDAKYINDPNSPSAYFPNKKAGMYIMSRATVSNFEANGLTNVAFLPFPVFDKEFTGLKEDRGVMPYGSSGYALCSRSKNKELAWEFIKFTMSEEAQIIMSSNGTIVPIIKSLQTDPNAAWVTGVSVIKDIDQSAFTFKTEYNSIYTRVLGNFAKDIAPEKESSIYTVLKRQINSINSATYRDKDISVFCADTQKALEKEIGVF